MRFLKSTLIIALLVFTTPVLANTLEKALISITSVIHMLEQGNERFVSGKMQYGNQDAAALARTAPAQHPVATILSCSDSRVPVEKIFDMGIGELFVVRVAGNVCDVDETGTIEYGTDHLNTPVLLVLGHSKCGAVTAVASNAQVHGSIPPLVENIVPAVERAREEHPKMSAKELVPSATVENVWQSIEDLLRRSEIVRERVESGKLKIIGGVYHLEDSKVEWLGSHPHQSTLLADATNSHPSEETDFYATMHREWPDVSHTEAHEGMTGPKALDLLKQGNKRFSTNKQTFPHIDWKHLDELVAGQHPFATVLTCSDSRLPAEVIFDAGAGDIFVVRVAGNVADVDETGSVEYGVGHVGTPLLVVLGHTACGAVTAVVTGAEVHGSIPALVDNIIPAAELTARRNPSLKGKDLVPAAIKANVFQSIEDMFQHSPEICALVKSGKLMVQGAVYSISKGSVEWLGPHPDQKELVEAQYSALTSNGTHAEEPSHATDSHDSHSSDDAHATESKHRSKSSGGDGHSSKLDEAIHSLESNVKSHSKTNEAAHATSRGSKTSPNYVSADFASVNAEIENLRSQVADLITEIEYLKAESSELKGENEQSSMMLASLDDAAGPASDNSKKIDKLAELVLNLNETIENQKSSGRPSGGASHANAPTVKHGTIQLTGFVHEQYYSNLGEQKKSSFESKRARLGVSGDINSLTKIEITGEFAKTPKLLDGFMSLSLNKNWNFRVGQYKVPFSSDIMRSTTAMPFVNLAQVTALGPDRDFGMSVRYSTKFTATSSLDLYTGFFNGAGINASDVNSNKNIVFRAETKFADMFTVAPNWYVGKTNDTGILKLDMSSFGSSVAWNWQKETVEFEYIGSKVGDTKKSGWYIWGGHTIATNSKLLPEIQLALRYDELEPNLSTANDRTSRVTFGTNLFIDKKYTLIQVNYQLNGEQGTQVKNDEFLLNFQVAF